MNKHNLLSTTLLYSIGEIVPRIISFLLLPIFTRYLSPAEYGISSYTTSVMTFVFVIAALSLNTFVLRNYFQESTEQGKRNLIGSIFYFMILFNVFILVIQILFFPFLISHFKIDVPFYPFFLLAIFNNFFDVISIIPLAVYRVKGDAKGFLILGLSRTLLQFLSVYTLLVYFDMGLEGSYYGRLIINVPYAFVYILLIRKHGSFRLDIKLIKEALYFSLPLLPGSISFLLLTLSDRIILERYLGLSELGIYSVAITLALALNVVVQALYKAFEPLLFKEFGGQNFNTLNSHLYKLYLFLLFWGAFAASLFSKEIFEIATSGDFIKGWIIVPFLVIPVIISGINTYLDILLIAEKKQKIISYATIVSAIISVALNLLLIPKFGYFGAIIASIISISIANIICHLNVAIDTRFLFHQILLLGLVCALPFIYDKYIILDGITFNIFTKSLLLFFFGVGLFKLFKVEVKFYKEIGRS